jgi:predicted MFS family arabinose efflux permease
MMRSKAWSWYLPFSAGHFANDIAPVSLVVLAPAIALELDLSTTEVGLLLALQGWGSAMGFLPAGLLADSVQNRGRLLMVTFWWVVAGHWLASLAPEFWTLALLLAFAGSGDAAWHPLATSMMVQHTPSRRAQALGIHAIGGTLSAVVGPLLVGVLLVHTDWRQALQVITIPGVLMGLWFLTRMNTLPLQTTRTVWTRAMLGSVARDWASAQGSRIMLMMSAYHMSLIALISMIPLYLQSVHGLSSTETGIAYAAMVLSGALAQPFIGKLSDVVGRKRVIVGGNGLAAVAAFLAVTFDGAASLPGTLAMLLLGVALLESVRATVLAAAVEFAGSREGAALGFAFSLMDGIGALGALLAGWVAGSAFSNAFLLSGLLATLAVLACLSASLCSSSAHPAR